MSGYYANVSNISGAKSSVATSAYMSREKLKDETMNHTFNYSIHEKDNTFSNICLCKNAPEEWQNKEKLWNAVEENEKGKNTRKAKQWILAIPQELNQLEREQAVKEFQEYLAEKGMCTQADIHEPDSKRSASKTEKNYHVHVLGTQRLVSENGEWEQIKEKKVYANCLGKDGKPAYNPELPTDTEHRIPKIDPETGKQKIGARNRKEWERVTVQSNPLDNRELIEESRKKWAEVCNKHLSAEQQIDHRSYDRQGIDKIAQIHEGIGFHHQDERAEYNKTVIEVNESMERMKSQAPETLQEVKESLNEVRKSLNNDGNSIRTTESSGRTAEDYPGTERSIRPEEQTNSIPGEKNKNPGRTESVTAADVFERIGNNREEQRSIDRKADSIREEQHGINKQANSLRDKLISIREKLVALKESVSEKLARFTKENKEGRGQQQTGKENTLPGMNRFSQIQAQQQAEKEQEKEKESRQEHTEQPQSEQKESVRDKLARFTQESKDGRTEPLQSEQKQEQTIHKRRGQRR